MDRWTVLEVGGAALLGGGVWAQWGLPWAAMLLGVLLLVPVAVRAWVLARLSRGGRSE